MIGSYLHYLAYFLVYFLVHVGLTLFLEKKVLIHKKLE